MTNVVTRNIKGKPLCCPRIRLSIVKKKSYRVLVPTGLTQTGEESVPDTTKIDPRNANEGPPLVVGVTRATALKENPLLRDSQLAAKVKQEVDTFINKAYLRPLGPIKYQKLLDQKPITMTWN